MCSINIKRFLVLLFLWLTGELIMYAGFPNGEWEFINYDKEFYSWPNNFISSFEKPDPNLKIEGYSSPYGYYQGYIEDAPWAYLAIFSNPKFKDNEVEFTVTLYSDPGFDDVELIQLDETFCWKAEYDPVKNSVKLMMEKAQLIFPDPNRQRWVVSAQSHNINIRKAPVNGTVIGKAPMGKVYKVKKKHVTPKYDTWFEIDLGNGASGFVSGEYFWYANDYDYDLSTIPSDAPKENITYRSKDGMMEFARQGNLIMVYTEKMNGLNDKGQIIPASCYVRLGRIKGNMIEWYKWDFMGLNYVIEKNFSGLEQDGVTYYGESPEQTFYYNGIIFEDGEQYRPCNND